MRNMGASTFAPFIIVISVTDTGNRKAWLIMKKKRRLPKGWNYVLLLIVCLAAVGGVVGHNYQEKQKQEKQLAQRAKNAVKSVKDLDGKKIGVQIGTTGDIYASDYEGDDAGTVIERYNKGTDAIQALKNGKINCVIIDEQPAKAYTEKDNTLKILKEEFALEDYAVCIDKSNTDLKEKINEALTKLKEDGTLQDIIDNYIGEDSVKGTKPYEIKDVKRNGTLKMATNASFKPYEYYENNKITGIDVDMMQAVCDELGMKLEVEDMEFDSIIPAVTSGKADVGAAGMTVTKDRLKNIDFTESYTTAKQVIITIDPKAGITKSSLAERFHDNFIKDNRYQYIVKGLQNTLLITVFAVLFGIIFGFVIAYLLNGASYDKLLFIISDHHQALKRFIIEDLDRSATYIKSKGMYTDASRDMIFLVVSRKEVHLVQHKIKEIDPAAFVVVTDAYETFGEGFKQFPDKNEIHAE